MDPQESGEHEMTSAAKSAVHSQLTTAVSAHIGISDSCPPQMYPKTKSDICQASLNNFMLKYASDVNDTKCTQAYGQNFERVGCQRSLAERALIPDGSLHLQSSNRGRLNSILAHSGLIA